MFHLFTIERSDDAIPFAKYQPDGATAAALRQFPDWRSVYVAAPGAIPAQLIHNIAALSGACVCADAGLPVLVNDRFLSLHGGRPPHRGHSASPPPRPKS